MINSGLIKLESRHFWSILLPNSPIIVQFETEQKVFFMLLSKDEVRIDDEIEDPVNCFISGDEDTIHQVIEGKIKLQDAIQFKKIQVKSSYRMLLLLESIFWLNAGKSLEF